MSATDGILSVTMIWKNTDLCSTEHREKIKNKIKKNGASH